jgi:protein-disulfide isomerase
MVSHKEKEVRKAQRANKAKKHSPKKSMSLGTKIGIAVILLIIVAFFLPRIDSSVSTEQFGELTVTQISPVDHVKGNPDGQVLIVEYSDFECPACAAYEPLIDQVIQDYGDNVAVAYRHFPLKQIHPDAVPAARASEAAANQSQFWPYHDILFERQAEWSQLANPYPKFVEYAEELGLDVEQFERDYSSDYAKGVVEFMYRDAIARNLRGTPSIFLNGNPVVGVTSYEDLARQVERALR